MGGGRGGGNGGAESVTSSPAKRAKIGAGAYQHSATAQSNLRDLFARTPVAQQRCTGSLASGSAGSFDVRREEDEMRWAIEESLKEAERVKSLFAGDDAKDNRVTVLDAAEPHRPDPKPIQRSAVEQESEEILTDDDGSSNAVLSAVKKVDTPSTGNSAPTAPFNAFSKLMSTHSEAKEWATADVVETRNRVGAARSRVQHRTAPFYKVLTGMPISVDAFRFGEVVGCNAYFLSHFHADHYGGLTSAWTHGPIYCSITTANLVRSSLRVQDQYVCPLPMNETFVIPRTGGVRVTLLDANHCPGSCVFLFEGPQTCHILPTQPNYKHPALAPAHMTFRYLHCGDFRASPRHANHPLIKGKRLDIIYLDTTYCNPRYCFPAQEMVVESCAELLRRVVPEQCRRGQFLAKLRAGEVTEEDWRTSPLRGRKLEAAIKAEEDKKSADTMRGWLKGESGRSDNVSDAVQTTDDRTDEDENDLSGLQFEDEELGFAARRHPSSDEQALDWNADADSVGINKEPDFDDADSIRVKEEPEYENMLEENEDEEVKDEVAPPPPPSTPKREPATVKEETEKKDFMDAIDQDYARALVVVGTYTIGKEKIVMACAKALGTRVYCADPRKYRVYAQLDDGELHSYLTRNPLDAYVHVTSLMSIGGEALQEHTSKMRSLGMRIDRAIAFRPTGWTYRPPAGMDVVSPSLDRLIQYNQRRRYGPSHMFTTRDSTPEYSIYGVPYSEHSSFFELTAFCLSVEYGRIIATVNVGNPNSRAKMARWFDKWKAEKKRRNNVAIESRTEDYF